MKALALNKLKIEMAKVFPLITLNYDGAIVMFAQIAPNLETFNRQVHAYFFETYAIRFADDIQKVLRETMECIDEILLSAAIPILCNKLPNPDLRDYMSDKDYSEESAKLIIATIIWHVLMDTNEVKFNRESKKVDGKWQTLTTLLLGGTITKEQLQGMHFKAGISHQKKCGGKKLSAADKFRLKRLASVPFELSDIVTPEIIMKGFTLKEDWNKRVDKNGKRLSEHYNTKVERFKEYRDTIISLLGVTFYLELEYWLSGRMGYKLQLEGMRPQGKQWETLMIDSAVAYDITEEQQLALMHHIYCRIFGVRVTPQEVLEKWDESYLEEGLKADPMSVMLEDYADSDEDADAVFGELILLKKASIALSMARKGIPTKYMFGWDFTTSGLIVAGNSFHSEEMMKASNSHNELTVHDAHTDFNTTLKLGLTRKKAKSIHQPLLHGCTWDGLLEAVHEATGSDEMELAELQELMHGAYGDCVENIIGIADWGTTAVSNSQTKVQWKMPDGFIATHRAYFKSVHNKVTVVSCDPAHKSGKTTHTIIKDMPYCTDNKGRALTLMSREKPRKCQVTGKVYAGKEMKAKTKVRGLYANITHSGDSYVLRKVVDKVLATGMPILLKHDDFMVHPSSYDVVLDAAQDGFSLLYETNIYQLAMKQIAEHSPQSNLSAPALLVGNADNVMKEATAFLMP